MCCSRSVTWKNNQQNYSRDCAEESRKVFARASNHAMDYIDQYAMAGRARQRVPCAELRDHHHTHSAHTYITFTNTNTNTITSNGCILLRCTIRAVSTIKYDSMPCAQIESTREGKLHCLCAFVHFKYIFARETLLLLLLLFCDFFILHKLEWITVHRRKNPYDFMPARLV